MREKGEGSHMQRTQLILSSLLVLMGSIDCITTAIGLLYSGAKELNPLMAGIVNSNFDAFLVVKMAATISIACTYILANKMVMLA